VAPDGRSLQGRSELTTLAEDPARVRSEIRAVAAREEDASLWALAAEVDFQLGLFREAKEALTRLHTSAPQDAGVKRRLSLLTSSLHEP